MRRREVDRSGLVKSTFPDEFPLTLPRMLKLAALDGLADLIAHHLFGLPYHRQANVYCSSFLEHSPRDNFVT